MSKILTFPEVTGTAIGSKLVKTMTAQLPLGDTFLFSADHTIFYTVDFEQSDWLMQKCTMTLSPSKKTGFELCGRVITDYKDGLVSQLIFCITPFT